MALLEVKGLTKHFGGLAAVQDLDFAVNQGDFMGLIGPNGAGKTTVLNLISGFLHPAHGRIIFKGRDITGHQSHKIVKLGLTRIFQSTILFKNQTVLQNIVMGFHLQRGDTVLGSVLNTSSFQREREKIEQRAVEILKFMDLAEMKDELAMNLPHGFQRTLGISIALATNPELILLDEPVTGMNPVETWATMTKLRELVANKGISLLLVEHDMKAVMGFCTRIVVLNFGKKIAEGVPEIIKENKDVVESYLGSEENE
jgi:branched-chain amino acid transport system ATP-binding protein